MPESSKNLFVIIGLGNFGASIAKTIANAGGDVIAMDKSMILVQQVAEFVPNAVCADSRDIEQLKEAGVQDADTAVVAMGSHLEDSVITILNLKELGVKDIIAKANSDRFRYVLERIGADTVIEPENEMGQRIAISLMNPKISDIFQMADDYAIMEIKAPELWVNREIQNLNLRELYGVNVIGIRKAKERKVNIDFKNDTVIRENDYLVIAADATKIATLNLD